MGLESIPQQNPQLPKTPCSFSFPHHRGRHGERRQPTRGASPSASARCTAEVGGGVRVLHAGAAASWPAGSPRPPPHHPRQAAPPPRRVAPRHVPRGAPRVKPGHPYAGPVLTVSVGDVVYEEHYVNILNFSWPQVACVTQCSIRGSRLVLISFCDKSKQIEKFAVRFPQLCDAESFLNCVKVYTPGVPRDVVAAKEMTADKVKGAGEEIDITIKRGIMSSIKSYMADGSFHGGRPSGCNSHAACEIAQFGVDGGSCCDPHQPGDQRTKELDLQHGCGTNRSLLWFSDNMDTIMLLPFCNGHGRAKRGGSLVVSAICWHTDIVVATQVAAGTTQAVQRRAMPAQG